VTSGTQPVRNAPPQPFPDRFKSPVSVLWDITGACELSCVHCCNSSGGDGGTDLSDAEALDVARQLVDAEVVHVCISGGEPLLRRPLLERILPLFAEHRVIVTVVTSGFGFTAADADLLIDNGVRVSVSLDGARPETHDRLRGRQGSFDQAVSALRLLAGRVPTLKIMSVATRANAGEFGDIVDLAVATGNVYAVEAHLMVERGRALANRNLQLTPADRRGLMETIAARAEKYGNRPICVFNDPTLGLRRLLRSGRPTFGIVIAADGTVLANPWVPVTFGSLRRTSLAHLWREGLDNCWCDGRLTGYLRGMRTVNALGPAAGDDGPTPVDFYSL